MLNIFYKDLKKQYNTWALGAGCETMDFENYLGCILASK